MIVSAVALPRLWLYRGLSHTHNFTFADQIYHLYHLDLEAKKLALPAELLRDPYFEQFPETMQRVQVLRWPGAVYVASTPVALLFGPLSVWTVQLTNVLFLALLLWGLIGLGRSLHSLELGLWAALLMVLLPAGFAATWYYSLDFPLAAVCIAGLRLLLATDGLRRRWPSLAFGLLCALGMSTKPTFALYLWAPSLVVLVQGLRQGPRLRVLAHALSVCLLGLGLFFLWVRPDFIDVWGEFINHLTSSDLPASAIPAGSRDYWLSQPIFAALNFPLPLLLMALPGLILLHGRLLRDPLPGRLVLVFFFWGSLLCLTLMANKLERYLHPVYPLICLACAYGPVRVLRGAWQRGVLGLMAAAFAGVLVLCQWHPTPWMTSLDNRKPTARMWNEFSMPGLARLETLRQHPRRNICELEGLVETVLGFAQRGSAEGQAATGPLGMAFTRRPGQGSPELPFGELVLMVAQELRDRPVVTAGLFGLDAIPGSVAMAPRSVVFFAPGQDPTAGEPVGIPPEVRVLERRTLSVPCDRGDGVMKPVLFTMALCQPAGRP